MKRKYNYFYKITNNINNHFYYGVHCTDNLNDGYMGSGKRLHYAYKKYGIENFTKEILKYFDSSDEAFKYEADFLTENLINNPNCYNIQLGGKGFHTNGLATVMDKEGNCFDVPVNDPRYTSGELVGITKGWGIYKDTITGKRCKAHKSDPRIKCGQLVGWSKNLVIFKDINDNSYILDKNDPNFENIIKTKNLRFISFGKVTVKDKDGNTCQINVDDLRYLTGELIPIWKNRKHNEETKKKMSRTHQINKDQQGEKNSQYGTCWIYKIDENNKPINIKIKKEELNIYINDGWNKGRKMK